MGPGAACSREYGEIAMANTETERRTRTREYPRSEHRPVRRGNSAAPNRNKLRRILSRWLLGFAIFYDELVFKFSTSIRPAGFNLLLILLYSAVLGMVLWLLASIAKTRRGNRKVKKIMLLIIPLLFCIEYFIYRQFKVFYDLHTIFNGAGHMLTGFMKETLKLVFSLSGLWHIFLFYLPTILYFLFGMHVDACRPPRRGLRLALGIQAAILLLAVLLLIRIVPVYHNAYSVRYSFQNAVDTFGLMPGVRLDIKNNLFASKKVGFETEQTEEPETGEAQTPSGSEASTPTGGSHAGAAKPSTPVSYGYNKLDIDFKAMAEEAGGTEAEMDAYVASLKPTKQNEYTGIFRGKNLILITAEAFSAEVIDPKLTPTLYRLATKGINFTDYTQSATAGTTGGEYAHIFGMLPTDGGSSMNDTVGHNNYYTMGSQLNRLGYYGKAYHNNTYTYYDRDVTHVNLGYSDGYMGYGNGMEEFVTKAWPESDLEMFQGTLPTYIDKEHFNIYYMTVSGHNNYSPEENDMTEKHWDEVQDLPYSDDVKAYIAANLELEAGLSYLVSELEKKGIADDTVICMTADHFPYGLDHDAALGNMPLLSELYGYEVNDYFQRDHNRLIIWCGALEKKAPIVVNDPVSCVDILPTLSNLFGLEFDSRLMPGRDVFSDSDPLVWTLFWDWKTDLGTYIAATNTFTPVSDDVQIPEDYVEKINAIVSNKISYCKGCLSCDYFGHVFGDG